MSRAAVLAAVLSLSAGWTIGGAATEPAQAAPDAGHCLASGDIWLVVQAKGGSLLANTCVNRQSTGTQVLATAGLALSRNGSGMICAIAGVPNPCPASFDGNYWHYFYASETGAWIYSELGSDSYHPAAGSLQGWCYGTDCTPVMPARTLPVTNKPSPTQPAASIQPTPTTQPTSHVTSATPAAAGSSIGHGSASGLVATIGVITAGGGISTLLYRRRAH